MSKQLETRTAQVQLRAAGDFVLEGIAAGYGTVANIAGNTVKPSHSERSQPAWLRATTCGVS